MSKINRETAKEKILFALSSFAAVVVIGAVLFSKSASLMCKIADYNIQKGNLNSAITILENMGNYKKSRNLLDEAYYKSGEKCYLNNNIIKAKEYFIRAEECPDAERKVSEIDFLLKIQGEWKNEKGKIIIDGAKISAGSSAFSLNEDSSIYIIDTEKSKFTFYTSDDYLFYFELGKDGRLHQFNFNEKTDDFFEADVFEK